jgi:hypothetical protein
MDFADATLVVLAEEADIDEAFTLDMRGFQAYRIHGRKSFKNTSQNFYFCAILLPLWQ